MEEKLETPGGETGFRIGLIDFPCFRSLSPGCMKHLILDDEPHADRKDHLDF